MATTKVSLDEYLRTSHRPDAEYIDGELRERNVGEIEHAEMILAVLEWFIGRWHEWQIRILPEVRVGQAGPLPGARYLRRCGIQYNLNHNDGSFGGD